MKNVRDAMSGLNYRTTMFEETMKAVVDFAESLIVVGEKYGEVGSRGRALWLLVSDIGAAPPDRLSDLLLKVDDTVSFLDNWTECATGKKWWLYEKSRRDAEEESNMDPVHASNLKGEAAREALHKYIDELRRLSAPSEDQNFVTYDDRDRIAYPAKS